MSRTVHILKLYKENSDFFSPLRKENIYNALLTMKYHDKFFKKVVGDFNAQNNISVGPLFHRGLSMPRLRILMALLAQMDDVKLRLKAPCDLYPSQYNTKRTPKRFREKFLPLMVSGFYLLGTVIEDSLSEDPSINCGNPFSFEHGDLGFWWAGIVILDWMKYFKEKYFNCKDEELKRSCHTRCEDFYNDPCLSRRYKYNQNSALSSLDRIPLQFLQEEDNVNFSKTIGKIDYNLERILCDEPCPTTEWGRLMREAVVSTFGMTLEESILKYQSDDIED